MTQPTDPSEPQPVELVGSVYRSLFEHSPEALFIQTLDGTIVDGNEAAAALTGWPRDELRGRHYGDLVAGYRDGDAEAFAEELRQRRWWRWTGSARRRDGSTVEVDVVAAIVDGAPDLALVHVTDVSDQKAYAVALLALSDLSRIGDRDLGPDEIAHEATRILTETLGAAAGAFVTMEDDRPQWRAAIGEIPGRDLLDSHLETRSTELLTATFASEAAIELDVDARAAEGRPLPTSMREAGVRRIWLLPVVSGHEHRGAIGLLFDRVPRVGAFDAFRLGAIGRVVGTALTNAILRARIEDGLALERALTARLTTLVELTGLPDDAADLETVGRVALERAVTVLGGRSGIVVETDGRALRSIASVALPPAFERLGLARDAVDWTFHRRLAAGGPPFVAAFEAGSVSDETHAAAVEAGLRAFAAFPLRDGPRLAAVALVFFDQPPADLPLDERTLEGLGRILDIAFANQRLRREASLSEERYRTLFEHSPVPLVLETLDGRVGDANAAALELYRADRDWLIGRSVDDITEWDAGELDRRRAAMSPTGWGSFAGTGRRADGTRFPEEVHATWVEIDGERRVLVRVQDLTDRERLQQELVQAQKMEAIGLLVSGVAHELNNPLASIVAFSQLIRTDPALPDQFRSQADMLIGEANRTRRIVQNLLDFARQRPPERLATDLRPLVDSVMALQSYTFGPGRIRAVVEIPDDLPAISVDRAQLQQVLVNLTLNAAQAIRTEADQGTIQIRATLEGDDGPPRVCLTVTDDGPGVPDELRSRLFMPFFTTKPPGEGTGLGLSVSFGIVTAHGGSLRYEPGPGGRGSRFVIELPVDAVGPEHDPAVPARRAGERAAGPAAPASAAADRAGAPGRSGPSARPGRDRPRILVLDDEAAIRAFLVRALERAGYEPIAAADGLSALELIRTDPPDAILCDHRMAGMSGTEFHAAVAAVDPDLAARFAFMSGDVLNPELREFATSRGIHLLAKPFDIDRIDRTVVELLRNGAIPGGAG